MVSINTNLSSIIAQRSMTTSTNLLNQAIERMSTGYKINHASDNAANYSISQNINAQMSSYDIAADNISMGMDLLTTAQDTIAGMQDRAGRLQAILTQARNGTYGAASLNALTSEATALVSEINRLYINTEYNGKKLFEIPLPEWAKVVKETAGANAGIEEGVTPGEGAGLSGACGLTSDISPVHNGFIAEVEEDTPEVIVTDPNLLIVAIENYTIIGIGNAETFIRFASSVNMGVVDCSEKTIVLTEDIDLTGIGYNKPIGSSSSPFTGTFNGNGHKVTGFNKTLRVDDFGLFGYVTGTIKNLGVEGSVTGRKNVGGLVGFSSGDIINCYFKGNVTGNLNTGGLVGEANGDINNCYFSGSVTGDGNYTGGLVGSAGGKIFNSYATGNVTGDDSTGGLAGGAMGDITNCYATGNVNGTRSTGGLAGLAEGTITNCYATGNVTGTGSYTGGLAGYAYTGRTITNSYATGRVTGSDYTGGLAGYAYGAITNCYATGSATGTSSTGGLAGHAERTITNCYATGSVSGTEDYTGGLAGRAGGTITNSYATGNVTGDDSTGGLAGGAMGDITNCYATGNVNGTRSTGGLAGYAYGAITNCYATGNVIGSGFSTGGLAGDATTITNCYAIGNVTGTGSYTGGLAGNASGKIGNCYATGNVSGRVTVGGLVGEASRSINTSYSKGNVTGEDKVGGFAGSAVDIESCYTTGNVISPGEKVASFAFEADVDLSFSINSADSDIAFICVGNAGPETGIFRPEKISLQVGINSDSSSQIVMSTGFNFNLNINDITSDSTFRSVTEFIASLNQKATELGAIQNRLESALESTMVSMDNLTSSLSTIRDADMAKVSSEYIRQQILQQAAATLMSTANQTPAIALQLL